MAVCKTVKKKDLRIFSNSCLELMRDIGRDENKLIEMNQTLEKYDKNVIDLSQGAVLLRLKINAKKELLETLKKDFNIFNSKGF